MVQRAEPLAVVFGVAFLVLHRRGNPASGLALFLALGCKESAVGFVVWALCFDVLASLSSLHIAVPAIVITGHDEPGNAERVYELGAADYLLKPLDESALVSAIERARAGGRQSSN